MTSQRERFMLMIGVVLGVLFLGLALRDTNMGRIAEALRRVNYWHAIPLLFCMSLFYWIKALRWRMLLTPLQSVTAGEVFPAMMGGFAGNNLLPAHLGEFVRVYLLGRQLGIGKSTILATIVLERCFDFLTILILLGVTLAFQSSAPNYLYSAGYFLSGVGLGILAVTILSATYTVQMMRVLQSITSFFPKKVRRQSHRQFMLAAEGFQSIRDWRLLIGITWTSLTQWFLMGLCLYHSMVAFQLNVGISAALMTLALIAVGITLPSAPGFFGTIELCFVLALRPYDIASEEALAAAAFYHLLAFASVTSVGLFCIHRCGSTLRKLHRQAVDA